MNANPYNTLPSCAYWRSAVAETNALPDPSYCTPKWPIARTDRIATAGSCFTQHIGRRLRDAGYQVIDAEPAPVMTHRFLTGSQRYGN